MSNYLNLLLLLFPVFAAGLFIHIKNHRAKPPLIKRTVQTKKKRAAFEDLGYGKEPQAPAPKMKNSPEANLKEDIFLIYLVAKPEQHYTGYHLIETFLNLGLRHGENDLFHRMDNEGKILFSVAQANKTGAFNLDEIEDIECKGLIFFMYPHPNNADSVLMSLLDTAKACATRLGGELQDAKQQALNSQTIAFYQQRFATTA